MWNFDKIISRNCKSLIIWYQVWNDLTKSIVTQLAPNDVFNRDIQGSKFQICLLNDWIIKKKMSKYIFGP